MIGQIACFQPEEAAVHKKAFLVGGGVGGLAGGILGFLFGFGEEGVAVGLVVGGAAGEILGWAVSG